jgi:hypothetical protein
MKREFELEVVGWQYYQNGEWIAGNNEHNHRKNTEEIGIPTRDLYVKRMIIIKSDERKL